MPARNEGACAGALVLDKPAGPTSHDMVYRVRRLTGLKTGHTGTLDPAATGVLPLLLGQAVRLSRYLIGSDKEYRAVVRLGLTTASDDLEGEVLAERPVPHLTASEIEDVLGYFRGVIEQVPPMYSAIKVRGERLYRAARRGETVERPTRRVEIYGLELENFTPDRWTLRIHCGSGTYIRSLARDLGARLDCGAILESLRRTRAGQFSLDDAVTLDQLESTWKDHLMPIEELLPELPVIELDENSSRRVFHGNPVPLGRTQVEAGGQVRLFHQGQLLAIARERSGFLQPAIVFAG